MFKFPFKLLITSNCKIPLRLFSTGNIFHDVLVGQIALVTGASRGVGRGIAVELAESGAHVYITGRKQSDITKISDGKLPSLEQTADEIKHKVRKFSNGNVTPVFCDHSNPNDIKKLFDQIEKEAGTLDVLVNAAFSGAPQMNANVGKKFFECDPLFWDDVNNVGLRNNYICSVYAARMMAKKRKGLIVNISAAGGIQYIFNVPYGVGKAGIDRMSADMALELKPLNVAVVSLWPGTVQTELSKILNEKNQLHTALGLPQELVEKLLKNGETPEFVGKAVVGLASDPKIMKKSGKIHFTADLATEYKFVDVNGKLPPHMRSISSALEFFGWPKLATLIPGFLKVPATAMHFASNKFYKL